MRLRDLRDSELSAGDVGNDDEDDPAIAVVGVVGVAPAAAAGAAAAVRLDAIVTSGRIFRGRPTGLFTDGACCGIENAEPLGRDFCVKSTCACSCACPCASLSKHKLPFEVLIVDGDDDVEFPRCSIAAVVSMDGWSSTVRHAVDGDCDCDTSDDEAGALIPSDDCDDSDVPVAV